ncbi:MAG: hypothetical protein KGL59_16100 [Acidobacteriota bacterium]|nr:hypothetical protein [Acidobacteriota bacterium]
MAEAQASLVSNVPMYRVGLAGRGIASGRAVRVMRHDARKGAEKAAPTHENPEQTATADTNAGDGRRAYNREYMRLWRKRNQERYRIYNREYQRKRHVERKIARILKAPAEERNLCGYGCGRAAVETIERIDPRTWKAVQIPYCGHC